MSLNVKKIICKKKKWKAKELIKRNQKNNENCKCRMIMKKKYMEVKEQKKKTELQ